MKIRLALVLAIILGAGTSACASAGGSGGPQITGSGAELLTGGERPQQTDHTRAAEQALDQGGDAEAPAEAQAHYERALAAADSAVAEIPNNPLAHRLRALALLRLERYAEAGDAFDRASELRPIYELEDEPLRERIWVDLYQEAAPLVNQGDYEGAAEIFEDANAIYDRRPEAMITLGQLYAQLRRHEESLENLDRAMELMSDTALIEQMDSATVASWEEQANEIPFLRAQVLADWGSVLQGDGQEAAARQRFREAAETFQEIADADPDNLEALRNVATLYMEVGDTAEAFAVYDELMTRPGLDSEDYYVIGVGYYQGDDVTKAADAFRRAAEESPMDRDAIEMWARSLLEDSLYAEVTPVAERWIGLDPYSQQAHLILAQSHVRMDNQAAAGDAVRHIETLEVFVENLQLTRFGGGGAQVTGTVRNQQLEAGTAVTLQFIFYDSGGNPLGTVDQTVNAGGEGMAEVFRVEFDSDQQVGGYGYDVRIG